MENLVSYPGHMGGGNIWSQYEARKIIVDAGVGNVTVTESFGTSPTCSLGRGMVYRVSWILFVMPW